MGMSRATSREHDRIELHLSSRAPGQARRWVLERGGGLPPGQLDLLVLLVSELVTNSVRHSGAAPGDCVEIGLGRWKGTIHVDVHDPGPASIAMT